MNPAVLPLVLGAISTQPIPQNSVLPVFGCGTGCRVETEQLSLPEKMPDGWIRVKVKQRTWIQQCNWETKECVDKPASGRAGVPVQTLWLFAECKGERFAVSKNPERTNAWEQSVYYEDGDWKGNPKYQTVHGNPFMRWAKLCPIEAKKGEQQIRELHRSFQNFFENKP